MTNEEAMATLAVHIYNQHVGDNRHHAALGGYPCGTCRQLKEAAATLQEAATASVGLALTGEARQ